MQPPEPANPSGFPPFLKTVAGKAFDSVPPFTFTGVTMRSFPLRADIGTLQRFIDSYLNIIPEEVGRFRVMAPYVNLLLLDYGKMDITVRNVGWLAQREIVFNIPLAWYTVKDGQWLFKDWATLAPFIYVDDDFSLATGRNVYGWTKARAWLAPTLSDWIKDVRAPIVDARVVTKVFPKLFAGASLEERTFLEVRRERPMSILGAPFDPASPLWPWNMAGNIAAGMAAAGRASSDILAGGGLWPLHPSATTDNALAMMGHAAKAGFPLRPTSVSNPVNLKQFHLSGNPENFCFQAVTNGPMRMLALNEAGLLGEDRTLLGDTTGGYTIRLHDWPSLPIVATLGLETAARWRGEECDVVDLKPVMPSWADVNMVYEAGYNLAWREPDGAWHGQDGTVYPRPAGVDSGVDSKYVTTLGAAQLAVAGPFRFSRTTIRVLPLLATRATLDQFLAAYLNDALANAGERFRVWSTADTAYVYLTVTSFGDVTSANDSIGDWARYELAYLIPVRREQFVPNDTGSAEHRGARGDWTLVGVGLVPAQTLVDNGRSAASNNEVLGIPTERAFFIAPENAWLHDRGPRAETLQTVLRVVAEVAPALDEGQKLEYHQLLEIAEGNLPDDGEGLGWRLTADQWAAMLRGELQRKKETKTAANAEFKDARDLALTLLGGGLPYSVYTMKQFPDIAVPTTACYQSLVRVQRTCSEVLDCREIETPLVVRVHEYPSNPIVSALGLIAKQMPTDGPGVTYALQPFRPFWMLATIDEALGERIFHRVGNDWVGPESPVPSFFLAEDGSARHKAERAAVTTIDPPMVIETLLSREWGNWSPDTRRRVVRRELEARVARAVAGAPESRRGEVERAVLSQAADEVRQRPGHWHAADVPAIEEIRRRIEALADVTDIGAAAMDVHREALLDWITSEWQKPDFVVRRDSAGPDAERLFPRSESWDPFWYSGSASCDD